VAEPRLPNFLIIGAARCGTTSLYHWLQQHPEIFLPAKKEPIYFAHGYGLYQPSAYQELFAEAEGKAMIGEGSTAYLSAPESPAWIRSDLGRPRLIVVLRNPVDRAFSLYKWMVMSGLEWLPTFEKALEAERGRIADHYFRWKCPEHFYNYLYFSSGLYCDQIARYFDTFDRDSVRVLLFEEVSKQPAAVFRELCEFLEVDPKVSVDLRPQNASGWPWSVCAQYGARRLMQAQRFHPGLSKLGSRQLLKKLMDRNLATGKPPTFASTTRERLKTAYREDVARLSELLGRDLAHWLH
jgi:hypothetical protein